MNKEKKTTDAHSHGGKRNQLAEWLQECNTLKSASKMYAAKASRDRRAEEGIYFRPVFRL